MTREVMWDQLVSAHLLLQQPLRMSMKQLYRIDKELLLHPMSVNFLKRLTEHQWIYL